MVRAAGERTEAACIEMFRSQLQDPAQLKVLHETPFSTAVIRTFEAGVASGRPWLIAVDADILPLPDAVDRVREICGKMADQAFCATPLFLCKTVGGFAMRGLHCYRASLLSEALGLTSKLPEDLRPESRFHDAMSQRGYSREVYSKVLGLHEYEQSYRHIYIKSKLRARKDPYARLISERLAERADSDVDARVARWAFEDVLRDDLHPTEYDWSDALPELETRLNAAGIQEKRALDVEAVRSMVKPEILGHPFASDTVTELWIREMLGFAEGTPQVVESLSRPPLFTCSASAVRID